MKILYIANIRVPTERAHGAQIMNMCQALASAGAEVVLCVPDRINHLKIDAFAYYRVEKKFNLKRLSMPNFLWLGRLGFYFTNIIFTLSVLFYVWSFKPDIIYGRDETSLLWLSYWHPRVVWEAHGGKWHLLVRCLVRRVRGIVVITQGIKDYFIDYGIPESKLFVAPDGLSDIFFTEEISQEQSRSRLGLPLGAYLVMYIGLLDEWKGYQTLLEASRLMDKKNTIVIIGGTSPQVEELKHRYPQVVFTGFLPYADLARNQRAADILVIPNSGLSEVSRTYTSPLKLFAHMASGVPLLVSDLPAFREIVDETDVYFFKPDSPIDLAQAIEEIRLNQEEALRRARQVKDKARQYTWEKRAQGIIKFIKNGIF